VTAVTSADSLSVLTTLSGVAVILMVLALALVAALICHDVRPSASAPPPSDVLTEPAVDARGLVIIGMLVLAAIIAAGQVIHWALA
jgi:hypothetical protein